MVLATGHALVQLSRAPGDRSVLDCRRSVAVDLFRLDADLARLAPRWLGCRLIKLPSVKALLRPTSRWTAVLVAATGMPAQAQFGPPRVAGALEMEELNEAARVAA